MTDARNVKVQYPGNIVNTYRPGLSLTCDANLVPSVVTIAGTRGSPGYSGDNGPATQAALNNPYSVCTDSIGNTYIADRNNARVRKIDTSGKITTFFTVTPLNGTSNFGITIDGNDILYITDPNYTDASNINGRIAAVDSKDGEVTGQIIPNNRNVLYEPNSVWVTNTDLYIANPRAETNIGTVSRYQLNPLGTEVYDQFYFPLTVAAGPDGSIYSIENPNQSHPNRPLASKQSHCVKRYKNGVYSIFAGISQTPGYSGDGGSATLARLNNPSSVFVDTVGNVYICDTGNGRIRMVTPDGIIQTIVGGGNTYNEGGAPLEIQISPTSMWFDGQGRMYFTDAIQHVVRRINSVYKPSWWDPFQYQKICKPCNAFVRPPPLPPVPTILNLELTDGEAGQGISADGSSGTAIPVTPSNVFVYLAVLQLNESHTYGNTEYIVLRVPNFNGEIVAPVSAYLNTQSLDIEYVNNDIDAYINVGGQLTSTVPIIVTFAGPINSINRVYSVDFPPPPEP